MGPILIYCRIFPLAGCCTYRCLGYVEQVVGYGSIQVLRAGWLVYKRSFPATDVAPSYWSLHRLT